MTTENSIQPQTQPEPQAPALRSGDLFGDRALASLMALSSDQRAHAYVQANIYVWPDAVKDLKPDGWDGLDHREKVAHPDGKKLWRVLNTVTSKFERSRQWWREELKRTDAEHLAWWSGNSSSPNEKAQPRAGEQPRASSAEQI